MKTEFFNLVDEPWLPVTLHDNFPMWEERGPMPMVSLREVFEHGERIVDLRCYPHERIALMRLLICIAQRALNGPDTEEEWRDCAPRIGPASVRYLEEKWECFNLFGDGKRFLQVKAKGEPKEHPVSRLQLVDKEASTLFDAHVTPQVCIVPNELARALVSFQSFSAGGKVGGSEVTASGKKEAQEGEAAICRDSAALHAFVVGNSLVETVYLNLISREQVPQPMEWTQGSLPTWEYDEQYLIELEQRVNVKDYLARLVPITRAVWLDQNSNIFLAGNGLKYGVFSDSQDFKTKKTKKGTAIREMSCSLRYYDVKSGQKRLVSAKGARLPKAVWRELHAITVIGRSEKRAGPVAMEHVPVSADCGITLWCGALVSDKAKVLDVVEGTFRLPLPMLENANVDDLDDPLRCPGPNAAYAVGVQYAEEWVIRLKKAVKVYRESFKGEKSASAASGQASLHYWTTLERKSQPVLLRDVALNSSNYYSEGKSWMAESPWGAEVRNAARRAYEFACPRRTPRQIRAFAAGLNELYSVKDARKEKKKQSAI